MKGAYRIDLNGCKFVLGIWCGSFNDLKIVMYKKFSSRA